MTDKPQHESKGSTDRCDYCCPVCQNQLRVSADAYQCQRCEKDYPVLFGIPDFRLWPDPYLSIEDERRKAAHLFAFGQSHSFQDLLREYYRITDDVPDSMAERFIAYVNSGPDRGRLILDALALSEPSSIADIGCATGGFVIAAARQGHGVVGIDIALRWLVICAKRLEEEGIEAELVCADVDALPFPGERFQAAVAADLMEHLDDQPNAAQAIRSVVKDDARLYLSGANRFTLAPYPLAGLWGVGFLPSWLRERYVTARRGIDTLRYANIYSPHRARQLMRQSGWSVETLTPLNVGMPDTGASVFKKTAIRVYRRLRNWPITRQVVLAVGPAFELVARKPRMNS